MFLNMENDSQIAQVPEDDYLNAAAHIFETCGPLCSELLPVETIMKVMSPFIGYKKSEYRYLYSIVDPEGSNPSISVKTLASALKEYSDKNNTRIDNSCVNMGNGNALLDPPVLSEGFHETLHIESELRERTHMMKKLEKQLEFTDRQHEEAIAAIAAERDELRARLQAMRDENTNLLFVKEENREMSEWSLSTEQKLAESSLELTMLRKRTRTLQDLVEKLELEKQSLNEMFLKSKEEYNRVSDIYSNRQTMLLQDNEVLKGEMSELERRHVEQEQLIQHLLKDKTHLEIELKDILNRSNRVDASHALEQSVDVSCSDASILRVLDSLNSDFPDEKSGIDFEPFTNQTYEEDYGRPSNVSLFDELRNVDFECKLYSDEDSTSSKCQHDKSFKPLKFVDFSTIGCQTDLVADVQDNCEPCQRELENNNNNNEKIPCVMCKEHTEHITKLESDLDSVNKKQHSLHNKIDCYKQNINALQYSIRDYEVKTDVYECNVKHLKAKIEKMERKKSKALINMISQTDFFKTNEESTQTETRPMKEVTIQTEINKHNDFLSQLGESEEILTPSYIYLDNSTQTASCNFEGLLTQTHTTHELCTQTESYKTQEHCTQPESHQTHELCTQTECYQTQELCTQTESYQTQELCTQTECYQTQELYTQTESYQTQELCTQTESNQTQELYIQTEISEIEMSTETKSFETQELCTQTDFFECHDLSTQTDFFESQYLCTLKELSNTRDLFMQTEICKLIKNSSQTENFEIQEFSIGTEQNFGVLKSTITTQTENPNGTEQCDISTQYENPYEDCLKHNVETQTSPTKKGLLSHCWDSLRGTFHMFTLICFILAILLLYNVMHYSMSSRRCIRPTSAVPWNWMTLGDVLSLVFRIEYVGEVPM